MEGEPMQIRRPKAEGGARPRRRRDLCPESLESRNLLSATGLVKMAPAEVRSAAHYVAMRGTIGGISTLGYPMLDESSGDVIVPVESTGSGQISHFGHVTMTESHTTTILASSGYATSLVTGGTATITAANGDRLFLAFSGTGVRTGPSQFDDTLSYTITGGTGRFGGASGSGVIHSTDEPSTPTGQVPFVFDLEGVISTVGSGSS
jgi:hypothetical protein